MSHLGGSLLSSVLHVRVLCSCLYHLLEWFHTIFIVSGILHIRFCPPLQLSLPFAPYCTVFPFPQTCSSAVSQQFWSMYLLKFVLLSGPSFYIFWNDLLEKIMTNVQWHNEHAISKTLINLAEPFNFSVVGFTDAVGSAIRLSKSCRSQTHQTNDNPQTNMSNFYSLLFFTPQGCQLFLFR